MTDRHEPGTTAERIAHLEALRVQSEHLDPKAEERQRARGPAALEQPHRSEPEGRVLGHARQPARENLRRAGRAGGRFRKRPGRPTAQARAAT